MSPSYNVENKFLLCDTEDSKSKTSWQSAKLALHESAVLSSVLLLPVSIGLNLQEDDAIF